MAKAPTKNVTQKQARAAAAEQRKARDRAAAEKQAAKDALATPEPVEATTKKGAQVSLAEANAEQRAVNIQLSDKARDAAKAAAKAVHKTLTDVGTTSRQARRLQKVASQAQN